jgi:ferritin-like metal-binding protein YciE
MPVEQIAVLHEKVDNLEERFEKHEKKQNGSLEKLDQRLERIEEKLNSRPSWSTSAAITILTSLTVGLATYIITLQR